MHTRCGRRHVRRDGRLGCRSQTPSDGPGRRPGRDWCAAPRSGRRCRRASSRESNRVMLWAASVSMRTSWRRISSAAHAEETCRPFRAHPTQQLRTRGRHRGKVARRRASVRRVSRGTRPSPVATPPRTRAPSRTAPVPRPCPGDDATATARPDHPSSSPRRSPCPRRARPRARRRHPHSQRDAYVDGSGCREHGRAGRARPHGTLGSTRRRYGTNSARRSP